MNWLPKKERVFFLTVIIILLILIFTSHIFGLLHQSNNYWYTGGKVYREFDVYSNFSFIEQARNGQWGFYVLGLGDQHNPYLTHPLWLLMGKFGAITNISNLAVWLLFQVIFIIIFSLVWWHFIKYLFPENKLRKFIFAFSLFAGGFYTWLHETNTFLILYFNPMHIVSLIFFLAIIWLALKFVLEKNKRSYAIWSGILSLVMFLNHFYDTISLIVVLTTFIFIIIIKKYNFLNYVKYLLIIGLITLPGVIYYIFIFTTIPAYVSAATACITRSPAFIFYFKSYGLLLFLSLLGIVGLLKEKQVDNKWLFIISWLVIQILILYSPLQFNRRLALGTSLPMSLLAGRYLWHLLNSKNYLKIFIIPLLITGLILGNFLLISSEIIKIKNNNKVFMLSQNILNAFKWVRKNTDLDTVFLADFREWETTISGFTGRFGFVLNGMTVDNWRFKFIIDFYKDNKNDLYKKQVLQETGIDYIWYGKYEKEIGSFKPDEKDYLELVFKSGEEEIYQVVINNL